MDLISRKPTSLIVSALCIVQFVWTLIQGQVTGVHLLGALLAVALFNTVFHVLYLFGHRPAACADEPVELKDRSSRVDE